MFLISLYYSTGCQLLSKQSKLKRLQIELISMQSCILESSTVVVTWSINCALCSGRIQEKKLSNNKHWLDCVRCVLPRPISASREQNSFEAAAAALKPSSIVCLNKRAPLSSTHTRTLKWTKRLSNETGARTQ